MQNKKGQENEHFHNFMFKESRDSFETSAGEKTNPRDMTGLFLLYF